MTKEFKRIIKMVLTMVLAANMIFGQFPSGMVLTALAAPRTTASADSSEDSDKTALNSGETPATDNVSEDSEGEGEEERAVSAPLPLDDDEPATEVTNDIKNAGEEGEGGEEPETELIVIDWNAVSGGIKLLKDAEGMSYGMPYNGTDIINVDEINNYFKIPEQLSAGTTVTGTVDDKNAGTGKTATLKFTCDSEHVFQDGSKEQTRDINNFEITKRELDLLKITVGGKKIYDYSDRSLNDPTLTYYFRDCGTEADFKYKKTSKGVSVSSINEEEVADPIYEEINAYGLLFRMAENYGVGNNSVELANELSNLNCDPNFKINIIKDNSDNFKLKSNVKVNQREIIIKFNDNKIDKETKTKESDGTLDLGEGLVNALNGSDKKLFKAYDAETQNELNSTSVTMVTSGESDTFDKTDLQYTTLIPGENIELALGENVSFEIKNNKIDTTSNYIITPKLDGIIIPADATLLKKQFKDYNNDPENPDSYIPLHKVSSSVKMKLVNGFSFHFAEKNFESSKKDSHGSGGNFWFNQSSNGVLTVKDDDVKVYFAGDYSKTANIVLSEDSNTNYLEIDNLVFEKNGLFVGPVKIGYMYDGTPPKKLDLRAYVTSTSSSTYGYNLAYYVIMSDYYSNDDNMRHNPNMWQYDDNKGSGVNVDKSGFCSIPINDDMPLVADYGNYSLSAPNYYGSYDRSGRRYNYRYQYDNLNEYVCLFVEDYAGNRAIYLALEDSVQNDKNKPILNVEPEFVFATDEQNKYLDDFTLKISALDKKTDTSTATGINFIKVSVYDGAGNQITSESYAYTPVVKQCNGQATVEYDFKLSDEIKDCFGYEMSVIVEAIDGASLSSFAYIYWDSTKNQLVATEIEDIKETGEIPLNKTFAVVGKGDNSPKINVIFDDDNQSNPNLVGDIYYYSTINDKSIKNDKRVARLTFSKMGISSFAFVNDNGELGGNISEIGNLVYNSNEHCYEYADENNQFKSDYSVEWEFEPNTDKNPYSIEIIDKVGISFTQVNIQDKNKRFVVDASTPDIKVSFDGGKAVKKEINGKKYTFYKGGVVATIDISGDNLNSDTEEFLKNYVEIYNNKDENGKPSDKTNYEDLIKKTVKKEDGSGYLITIDTQEDGYRYLHIKVSTNSFNSSSKSFEFIIDSKSPEFEITYEGATNEPVKGEYYYGLENGDGKASDMEVTCKITDANVIWEDVKEGIAVTLNGEELDKDRYKITHSGTDLNTYNHKDKKDKKVEFVITVYGAKDNFTNDGEVKISVTYSDPAGNAMVSGEKGTVVKGKYFDKNRKDVIDTVRPVAVFDVKDANGNKVAKHYDNDGDYYNFDFIGSFKVTDANLLDEKEYLNFEVPYSVPHDVQVKYIDETEFIHEVSADKTEITYGYLVSKEKSESEEGNYRFGISARDKANNTLIIKAGEGITDNDNFPAKNGNGFRDYELKLDSDKGVTWYQSGFKIYDITNPVAELKIDSKNAANKDLQTVSANNKRYFFNDDFTATFTVTDNNFTNNEEDLKFYYGVNNASKDYSTDSVDAKAGNKVEFEAPEKDRTVYTGMKRFDNEGLYKLALEAEDKAGNIVILSKAGEAAGNCIDQGGYIESYIIVIDKTAPELNVKIDDFYEAVLSKEEGKDNYNVKTNYPYQKLNNATVTFAETKDKSQSSITYVIESTTKGTLSKESNFEKNFKISVPMEGQQTFFIKELSVVDRAGNVISMPNASNKVYLDTEHPKTDELKPTISIVAKASGNGRGPEGNPLFSSDVNVEVNINDANDKISSSGLYKVFYSILVNGGDATGKCVPSSATGNAGSGVVTYNTDGSLYKGTADQNLTYNDKLVFNFNKGTFNYNDIKVRVWAEDNAGNILAENEAAVYAFGIDDTTPVISVSYTNNDAKNGKYFKAPRTAVVTVTERNFDSSRTHITTENGARIGGWEYHKGGSDNGDDDKWTANVVYDKDGDYTLNVSTTDLVNHSASGVNFGDSVAPQAFTIDLIKPVITVTFDNNDVRNGRYFNAPRRANINILEHNFDTKDVNVNRTASIAEGNAVTPAVAAWTRNADTNNTNVYFSQDGDYRMNITYTDLAGNVAEEYVVNTFTIDTVAPELKIGGVQDKHAYNGDVNPSITYHDINCNNDSAEVKITGYNHPQGIKLEGKRTEERFGGSYTIAEIEAVKENDDVYKIVGRVSDLAGNSSEKELEFSVNRFGSTYILSDATQNMVDRIYNNAEKAVEVKEINVNELDKYEVAYSLNGNTKTLKDGSDFTVDSQNPGWWEYNYKINPSNFTAEGNYIVTLYSEDAASNSNSNRAVKENNGGTNELPIEFVIDKTAPALIITGVEKNGRYRASERTVVIRYEDNSFVNALKVYANDDLVMELDSKALAAAGGEIEYIAKSSFKWQEIRVEAVDAASNEGTISSERFLLTSNFLIQFINNIPMMAGTGLGILIIIACVIALIAMRIKRKRL